MAYKLNVSVKTGKEVMNLTPKENVDSTLMLGTIQGCASIYKIVKVIEISENEYNIICSGKK